MNTVRKQPSEESRIILASLKEAVRNALDKKRRLGQYAVIWETGELVYKGEDAPQIERQQKKSNIKVGCRRHVQMAYIG